MAAEVEGVGRGLGVFRAQQTVDRHVNGDAVMLPVIDKFRAAYPVKNVIVVADAGMVSEESKKLLDAAGLGFVLGARGDPGRSPR